MISPFKNPKSFDYFVMAGQISPGCCKFKASKKYKWDAPDQKGTSGSDPTYQGVATDPFTVQIQIWTTPQWNTWEIFKPLLDYADDAKPQAYDFYHPYAAMLGIDAVTVDSYTSPDNDGKGLLTVDVTLRPFKRPKDAGGKVSGIGSGGGSGSDFADRFLNGVKDAGTGDDLNMSAPGDGDYGFSDRAWDRAGKPPEHPSHNDTVNALNEAQP